MSDTTSDCLLAVADQIEFHPETFDMITWTANTFGVVSWKDPYEIQQLFEGEGEVCGTTHCVAGWAVRYTTKPVSRWATWSEAGAAAFGFDEHLAEAIFMSARHKDAHAMAELLRHLAKIDESDRNLTNPAVTKLLGEYLPTALW